MGYLSVTPYFPALNHPEVVVVIPSMKQRFLATDYALGVLCNDILEGYGIFNAFLSNQFTREVYLLDRPPIEHHHQNIFLEKYEISSKSHGSILYLGNECRLLPAWWGIRPGGGQTQLSRNLLEKRMRNYYHEKSLGVPQERMRTNNAGDLLMTLKLSELGQELCLVSNHTENLGIKWSPPHSYLPIGKE